MRTFKKLLPLLAGIAVFLVCNQILNYLLIPYQFTRMKIHRIETESWQDLILGSSHGCSALDPAVLTEKTGRSCFNAAAGGQYPADNYYLLLDACRHHKPERVIFEYDPAYWIAGDPFNRNARYQLDVMAPSVVRARYFFDQFFNSDLRQVLMPWLAYRRDHLRIRQTLAVKQSEAYRTFSSEPFSTEYQTCRADGFTNREKPASPRWKRFLDCPLSDRTRRSTASRNWMSKNSISTMIRSLPSISWSRSTC